MLRTSLEGQNLGKYRVLEALGRGGMAHVYRAYHPRLDRYVAIKVMRPDLAEDDEFLARFQREAQSVAALRHPNIVLVHDFDAEGDLYYMVMELLEGDTLKTRLNDYRVRGERMSWGEMIRILLDVLDGLAYAHSEGMIHRDIKPANILLTRRGQAVIGDFGIAQIIGGTRHTAQGALMGTLEYMAPEQGLEGRSDARSDIYSLGIVFYEMLTQRTPFDADTPLAVLMKHLNDPLPLPRQVEPEIPEPLEQVVLKALAKRPQDRYQGTAKMAEALRAAVEEAGIELPKQVSPPLSFTTAESPSESVAVISGTTRKMLAEVEFAEDETDATLEQKLTEERAAEAARPRRRKAARRAERQEAKEARVANRKAAVARARNTGSVVLLFLGFVGFFNLAAITVSAFTNQWAIYERGWVMNFFLLCFGLSMIMLKTRIIWLLVPVGIVFGSSLMLGFSGITGYWDHWSFSWLLEVWLILGVVFGTLALAKNPDRARDLSVRLAVIFAMLSGLFAMAMPILAMISGAITGVLRSVFG